MKKTIILALLSFVSVVLTACDFQSRETVETTIPTTEAISTTTELFPDNTLADFEVFAHLDWSQFADISLLAARRISEQYFLFQFKTPSSIYFYDSSDGSFTLVSIDLGAHVKIRTSGPITGDSIVAFANLKDVHIISPSGYNNFTIQADGIINDVNFTSDGYIALSISEQIEDYRYDDNIGYGEFLYTLIYDQEGNYVTHTQAKQLIEDVFVYQYDNYFTLYQLIDDEIEEIMTLVGIHYSLSYSNEVGLAILAANNVTFTDINYYFRFNGSGILEYVTDIYSNYVAFDLYNQGFFGLNSIYQNSYRFYDYDGSFLYEIPTFYNQLEWGNNFHIFPIDLKFSHLLYDGDLVFINNETLDEIIFPYEYNYLDWDIYTANNGYYVIETGYNEIIWDTEDQYIVTDGIIEIVDDVIYYTIREDGNDLYYSLDNGNITELYLPEGLITDMANPDWEGHILLTHFATNDFLLQNYDPEIEAFIYKYYSNNELIFTAKSFIDAFIFYAPYIFETDDGHYVYLKW